MPTFFARLAQAATDAGELVVRTAASASEVLSDGELRRCGLNVHLYAERVALRRWRVSTLACRLLAVSSSNVPLVFRQGDRDVVEQVRRNVRVQGGFTVQ